MRLGCNDAVCQLWQVKELFRELLRARMEPNIITYNTVFRVWAEEADASKAVPLLYHLLKPQVSTHVSPELISL